MTVALLTIAVILVAYGALSKPLDRRGITSAMVFTAAGLAVGTAALGLIDIELESVTAERICELALVFLLFSDSMRLDLARLRRNLRWPSRLLLIGLPLTMLAGVGAGLLVFSGMALASVFLLSTMLCSTDAALGQRVITDEAVPPRVRQALDVESGLNDGLAVPFFLVAVDISLAQLSKGVTAAVVGNMAEQIGWGLAAGIGAGVLGGLLFRDGRQTPVARGAVAADPSLRGGAAGLRRRPPPGRQRLHRRLRRGDGLRSLSPATTGCS